MDAATIEETNRIRVSLGMKPLPVPGEDVVDDDAASQASDASSVGENLETREARAYDNYNDHMEAEAKKKRREQKAAAIRRATELAQRNLVLEGKGLGEEDEKGDIDAKAWLTGQKKRQKKIDKARKLEEELAAAEAAAAAAVKYTSKDLTGMKVAHDMATFMDGDGDDQILTLKDTTIDENEEDGDELENVGMREQEKLDDKLNLLKKRPGYNPMEDEALSGGILSQYDDEMNGKPKKKFTLDAAGTADLADILAEPSKAEERKLQSVNIDDIVDVIKNSSDYLDISEIKVKKPKKKKSKGTRQKQFEDGLFAADGHADEAMDLDIAPTKKRAAVSDTFVDDDDLQASLTNQRKTALKKRKKMRPEDIAREVQGQASEEPENAAEEGSVVIGAVSEFVSGLSKPEEREHKPRNQQTPEQPTETSEDHEMDDANGEGDHDEAPPPLPQEPEPEPEAEEEEKTVGGGMGAALSLLRERGLVEQSQGDEEYEKFRKRQDFLAKKQQLEQELDEETRRQREKDRASGRLDRMSVREREEYARQQNAWRDQQQARRMAELFEANYKPNVNIKYVDEDGQELDTKGAFKQMSHMFHGKGSGKGKTEKKIKKQEDEKRRQGLSLFDATDNSGMSRATAQQLKKRKEAGVRLA